MPRFEGRLLLTKQVPRYVKMQYHRAAKGKKPAKTVGQTIMRWDVLDRRLLELVLADGPDALHEHEAVVTIEGGSDPVRAVSPVGAAFEPPSPADIAQLDERFGVPSSLRDAASEAARARAEAVEQAQLREAEAQRLRDEELNGVDPPPWRLPAQRTGGQRRSFHNPYSFVPAPPRDVWSRSALGDGPPSGHHRLSEDALSGRLTIRMVVKTPLLVMDHPADQPAGQRDDDPEAGHERYGVRVRTDGSPDIQLTSLKGMLRAAYEAATNSRMGIFTHRGSLTRRMGQNDDESRNLKPVRVTRSGEELTVALMRRVRLPRYNGPATTYDDRGLPEQGDHVIVESKPGQGHADPKVTRIERFSDRKGVEGWVLISGKPEAAPKKHESVFVASGGKPLHVPDQNQLVERWRAVVDAYIEASRQPGAMYTSGPHLKSDYRDLLKLAARPSGALAWAEIDQGGRVLYLFPTRVSRRPFPKTPWQALPATVRPADSASALSPADRLFGWVSGARGDDGAHRGQVRIATLRCHTPVRDAIRSLGQGGVPLEILASPKPQQILFYAAGDRQGNAPPDGRLDTLREIALDGDLTLRGRKVYPNQNLEPAAFDRAGEPFRRHGDVRDKNNRSVLGWVDPGTTFTFDLHVTDVAPAEIGALLWLVTRDQAHLHRLGGGRPLGFGAVHLSLDEARLQSGAATAGALRNLSKGMIASEFPPAAVNTLIDEYLAAARELSRSGDDNPSFVTALERAMTGHRDGLPTRYPRLRPGEPGYDWFAANSSGPQAALPDLVDEPGLPGLGGS